MNGARPRPVELPTPKRRLNDGLEPHRALRRGTVSQVLDQIENEAADQEHRQHLGLERPGEFRPPGDGLAVAGAELARAIDRGRAHQIPDCVDFFRFGLAPCREAVDDVAEQSHRAVGPREGDFPVADPAGLLLGHVPRQALDIARRGHAVEQGERRIPGVRNDPVGAQFRRQVVGEADQAVTTLGPVRGINGSADAAFVDLE